MNDVFTTRPLLIKRAKIRLERDVSYIIVMSRFKREHSAGATTTTFSFPSRFLFCRHTQKEQQRDHHHRGVVLCVSCFARSNCIISWWCLFSRQKSLGYVLDPKRRRREEDATTETKKNQQPTKKRLRRNRSLRAYRYIHTNMYIYIYFFFYETNRQSKERSSRLGSGRSIRIGFR